MHDQGLSARADPEVQKTSEDWKAHPVSSQTRGMLKGSPRGLCNDMRCVSELMSRPITSYYSSQDAPALWEIFCGQGHLSQAAERTGLGFCLEPIDVMDGEHNNVADARVLKSLLNTLSRVRPYHTHFAVPCAAWSALQRLTVPNRSLPAKMRKAKRLVGHVLKTIRAIESYGLCWSIENPASSTLWPYSCHDSRMRAKLSLINASLDFRVRLG